MLRYIGANLRARNHPGRGFLLNHEMAKSLSDFILFVTKERALQGTLTDAFGRALGSSIKLTLRRENALVRMSHYT
jgi:hypothetical protein